MSVIKQWFKDIIYGNKITVIIRIFLGLVFILSSVSKMLDPELFTEIINRYKIVHEVLVPYAAIVIPYLELVIGVLLVIGYKVRASALLSVLLLILFIVFIAVNMFRGESFDCGCIDLSRYGFFFEERIGPLLLLRDVVYLLIGIIVFKAERHLFSIQSIKVKSDLNNIS